MNPWLKEYWVENTLVCLGFFVWLVFFARWWLQGEAFSTTRAKLSPGAWRQWHNCSCKVRAWVIWGWAATLLGSLDHRSIAGGKFQRMPGKGLFLCKEFFSLLGYSQYGVMLARLALLWSKGLPSTTTSFGTWCTAQPFNGCRHPSFTPGCWPPCGPSTELQIYQAITRG